MLKLILRLFLLQTFSYQALFWFIKPPVGHFSALQEVVIFLCLLPPDTWTSWNINFNWKFNWSQKHLIDSNVAEMNWIPNWKWYFNWSMYLVVTGMSPLGLVDTWVYLQNYLTRLISFKSKSNDLTSRNNIENIYKTLY